MLVLVALLTGLGLGLLTGGRIGALEGVRLRGEGWLLSLLALSVLMPRLFDRVLSPSRFGLARAAWAACLLAVAGLAFVNRRQAGMLLVCIGLLLNLVVIVSNQGMPVDGSVVASLARESTERPISRTAFHHEASADTRLAILGDRLPVPGPGWLRSIVSPGDVIMLVGLGVFVAVGMRGGSGGGRRGPEAVP